MAKKYTVTGGLVFLMLIFWLTFGSDSADSTSILISPKRGPFQVNVVTTGELRAKNSTSIRGPEGMRDIGVFNVTIQKLVPEGTVVRKGDFVAELDRSEITSILQNAQLDLERVQSEFEQAQLDSSLTLSQARDNLINLEYTLEERKLAVEQSRYESPAVRRQTQIDYEKTLRQLAQDRKNYATRVKQSEARLRQIEVSLTKRKNDLRKIIETMSKFTIHAPENGMVIYRRNRNGSKLTQGGTISAWDPVVAELPDFSVMESVTYVNEVDIQKVKEGQLVDIGLDANAEKELTGIVTSVANIGEQRPNSDSKVFEVVIEINEADTTLRPAMTTSNVIHINSLDNALFVPLETIHSQDSLSFVFKQKGLETVMQQVELGIMNDNEIVIHNGLTANDQLYLTIPDDTTGIRKILLSESITSN